MQGKTGASLTTAENIPAVEGMGSTLENMNLSILPPDLPEGSTTNDQVDHEPRQHLAATRWTTDGHREG